MINLISSQLYKIFRSKSTYILLIIACALPLLSVISVASLDLTDLELVAASYDCLSLLRGVAVVGSDYCVLAMIGIAIIFGKEYSEGTIRNTIMAGYNRTAIFVSSTISSTVLTLFITLPAFAVLGASSALFLGFGTATITASEIIANIGASLLVYTMANFTCIFITLLFVHLTQKVSLSIVFPLLIVLLLGGLISGILMALVMLGELALSSLSWIPLAQYYVYSGVFELGTYVLDWAIVSKIAIISIALVAILATLTWLRVKNSNIK